MSVSVFRSVAFNRCGVAGDEVGVDCALATEEAVRKSAVVPITIVFNIGDLLGFLCPQQLEKKAHVLEDRVDLNQWNQRR
jgi:hypothetical protein